MHLGRFYKTMRNHAWVTTSSSTKNMIFFSKKFNKMTLLKLLWVVFGEKMIYVYWFFWKQLHLFMKITIKVAIFGEIKVVILAQPETDHHDWFLTFWFRCYRNNYATVLGWRMTLYDSDALYRTMYCCYHNKGYFSISTLQNEIMLISANMCTHFLLLNIRGQST